MGAVELFAASVVGTVVHELTVERREWYFADWSSVRGGIGGGFEDSAGWAKGNLMGLAEISAYPFVFGGEAVGFVVSVE